MGGRAWLATARRRLKMLKLAEEWRSQREVGEACESCNVREDDPFVLSRVGDWVNGARLQAQVVTDLKALIISFEQTYDVPNMPFSPAQWRAWLDRHDSF